MKRPLHRPVLVISIVVLLLANFPAAMLPSPIGVATAQGPSTTALYVNAGPQGYTGANLRAQPSKQSTLLLLIPNGARLQTQIPPVKGVDGQKWYKVTYQGKTGYVLSSLLSKQDSVSGPPPSSNTGSDWPMAGSGPGQDAFNADEHNLVARGLHIRWATNVGDSLGQYVVTGGQIYALQEGASST